MDVLGVRLEVLRGHRSPQNRRASCLRYLLLSMTLQIRRQGGATLDCTISPPADDQHKHSSDVGYQK